MRGFLLDTNVLSELVRLSPEPRVVDWIKSADENLLHISVLTIGEISKGVSVLPEGKMRTQLLKWLDVDLRLRFARRTLAIDEDVALRWGGLAGQAKKSGRPLGVIDGLLAATAGVHDLVIVTRNVKDFDHLEVVTINPWQA